jgi:uncharacterized protein (DUF1330 family)
MTDPTGPKDPATLVVLGTFREGYEAHFPEYSRRVRAYLERQGGQVVRRQRIEASLTAGEAPSLVMLIDFPSREAAAGLLERPEYLEILPLRAKVFRDFQAYLAEAGEI